MNKLHMSYGICKPAKYYRRVMVPALLSATHQQISRTGYTEAAFIIKSNINVTTIKTLNVTVTLLIRL